MFINIKANVIAFNRVIICLRQLLAILFVIAFNMDFVYLSFPSSLRAHVNICVCKILAICFTLPLLIHPKLLFKVGLDDDCTWACREVWKLVLHHIDVKLKKKRLLRWWWTFLSELGDRMSHNHQTIYHISWHFCAWKMTAFF